MSEDDIDRVRGESDIICISLHWGYELYRYPTPEQVELAHQIIEVGADVIIGHHPHIVQGFERYGHGIIFYSLGNFFFPNFRSKLGNLHQWSEESNRFIIAKCQISKTKIESIEILPGFKNRDYQLVVLDGGEKESTNFEIDELSKPIKRSDYESFYNTYNKERTRETIKALLKRVRELGIKGCIARISAKNVKHIVKLLKLFLQARVHIFI